MEWAIEWLQIIVGLLIAICLMFTVWMVGLEVVSALKEQREPRIMLTVWNVLREIGSGRFFRAISKE